MNLAIATHAGLYFAEHTGEALAIREASKGYYYGLSCHNGFILAARRIDPTTPNKDSPTAFEIWTYDGLCVGTPYEINGNLIRDVHQITPSSRGHYICNANRNALVFIDNKMQNYSELCITQAGNDNVLLNSVFVDGNDLWTVQHSRLEAPSEIVHIQHLDDGTWVVCENYRLSDFGVHNIIPHDDKFYVCASHTGTIRAYMKEDFNTEDWERKGETRSYSLTLDENQHTKGLAADPDSDTLIVGISENGTLEERFTSESHLVFLNLSDLTHRQTFRLWHPDGSNLGNINEIRILD